MQHPYSADEGLEQGPQSPNTHPYGTPAIPPPPRGNAAGVIGFVLALLSPCTCGLLAPVALLLSLIGLRKQPRGLAIAGTIISLFFTLGCGGFWLLGGISVAQDMKAIGWDTEFYWEAEDIRTAAAVHTDNMGSPPLSLAELGIAGDAATDANGVPYVLRPTPSGSGIMLHGAGPDMTFNTADDVNYMNPVAADYMGFNEEYFTGSADLPPELIPEGN